MIRVAFIIRRFVRGGAERQLVELLKGIDKRRFDPTVICLYPGGGLWDEVRQIPGVKVYDLAKTSRWDISPLWRIPLQLRRVRPHVIHGYMDVANMIAALAGLFTSAKVVWGIRASRMDFSHYDWFHRLAAFAERALSSVADLVICNSEVGKQDAITRGVGRGRVIVIRNGIDTSRFRPDGAARERARAEWRIGPDEYLVGLPARLDPMKGQAVFVAAASMIAKRVANVRFTFIGDGPAAIRAELQRQIAAAGLAESFIWAGERGDIAQVLPGLDLAVSASVFGEGFSNSLAESMACGVPCVATRVGDAPDLLAGTGWLVPSGDVRALADAVCAALDAIVAGQIDRNALREHIERNFSVDRLAANTEAALTELVADGPESISAGRPQGSTPEDRG